MYKILIYYLEYPFIVLEEQSYHYYENFKYFSESLTKPLTHWPKLRKHIQI